MAKYKVASLFAGIGGIDLGFNHAGFKSIWANEIDPYAANTFKKNHPQIKLVLDDISNIKGKDIPNVDILVGGFPCQPFSVAGYRKGFQDDRGNLFFQIIRLIEEMEENNNKPQVILLENVKNLYTHDKGNTYNVIMDALNKNGYHVTAKVLNTSEYGNLPQNRERIFIVGFLNENYYDNFQWPKPIKLSKKLESIINRDETVLDKYYYTDESKIYPILKKEIINKETLYQYRRVYVRENKSNVAPTLTANMGMGGHNVPILLDNKNRIRKLTPKECLMLQGFPEKFTIPNEMADSRVYKQAGNSVSVSVIKRIAKSIKDAME